MPHAARWAWEFQRAGRRSCARAVADLGLRRRGPDRWGRSRSICHSGCPPCPGATAATSHSPPSLSCSIARTRLGTLTMGIAEVAPAAALMVAAVTCAERSCGKITPSAPPARRPSESVPQVLWIGHAVEDEDKRRLVVLQGLRKRQTDRSRTGTRHTRPRLGGLRLG